MKWKQRCYPRKNGRVKIVEPKKDGDYWVTDGWYTHMAHFWEDSEGVEWGIYQPNEFGVIKYCYSLDDMNFNIAAYIPVEYPKPDKRFQDL